jgi:hypothetical protein
MNYGIKEIYKYYKSYSENPVEYQIFVRAWKDFAEQIINDIVFTGKDFMMPFRIGNLGIRKHKIIVNVNADGTIDKRYLRPDWASTKKLWEDDPEAKKRKQLVFHLNKHFRGFNCKWFWDKSTCSITNQTAYSLVMSRTNKRKLAQAIFSGEVDYYEQKSKYNGRSN